MKSTVLFVGEGNFSFASSFISTFNGNVIASSYECEEELIPKQIENITKIINAGGTVLTGINAMELHLNNEIAKIELTRIQFNFPHATKKNNIKSNRLLLLQFFESCGKLSTCRNSSTEIWVALCGGQGGTMADGVNKRIWNNSWKIVQQATEAGFLLKKCIPFQTEHYPLYSSSGYRNKDTNFKLKDALIHIFQFGKLVEIPKNILLGTLHFNDEKYVLPDYYLKKIDRNLHKDNGSAIFKTLEVLKLNMKELGFSFKCFDDFKSVCEYSNGGEITLNVSDDIIKYNSKLYELFAENILISEITPNSCSLRTEMILTNCPINNSITQPPVQYHVIFQFCSDTPVCNFIEVLERTIACETVTINPMEKNNLEVNVVWNKIEELLMNAFDNGEIISLEYIEVNSKSDDFGELHSKQTDVVGISCQFKNELNLQCYCMWLRLDILACLRYRIYDPRNLWSKLAAIENEVFVPYSLFPMQYNHDMSFWLRSSIPCEFNECFMMNILRNYIGDILKEVKLIEKFEEKGRISYLYRFSYQSVDAVLTKSQCNAIQIEVRNILADRMSLILR